jgi:DNA invertase Pin-like site-specific DNA recombinase
VIEGSGEGGVAFCDLPHIPPGPIGKFIVTQMAAVAELEAGLISQRTKAALAQAKARGVRLGGFRVRRDGSTGHKINPAVGRATIKATAEGRAADLGPMVREPNERGLSLRAIAAELAARSIATPRRGRWTADAGRRLLLRAEG